MSGPMQIWKFLFNYIPRQAASGPRTCLLAKPYGNTRGLPGPTSMRLRMFQKVIRESRFLLILREQDGKTCMINSLTGERILKEGPDAQSVSKVERPCQDVWMQVRELDIVPEAARVEITELFENAS